MKKIMIYLMGLLLIASLSLAGVKKVRVIVDKASVYSSPKISNEKIDVFEKGTILNVLGSGEKNGWYNVSGRSQYWGGMISGFIQASQVELIDETPKPAPEVIKEVPKIEEPAQAQEADKPAEEKPAKKEEPEKAEEIAKPEEIRATEKATIPVAYEEKAGRKKITIRLGYNAGFATQSNSVSWQREIYYENAAFGVDYNVKKGNSFNCGLGYKFSRSVGVEIGVDIASRNLNASYDASIPHPLYFNSPREAVGSAGYKVSENAAYINLVLTIPISRLGLDFFVGPAYFFTSAELIGGLQYSQSYPYSSVTLNAQNQKISKNVIGFNGGASLTFYFTQSMALFIVGQYFSGTADFQPSETPGLKLSLGGLKAGGGIKVSF